MPITGDGADAWCFFYSALLMFYYQGSMVAQAPGLDLSPGTPEGCKAKFICASSWNKWCWTVGEWNQTARSNLFFVAYPDICIYWESTKTHEMWLFANRVKLCQLVLDFTGSLTTMSKKCTLWEASVQMKLLHPCRYIYIYIHTNSIIANHLWTTALKQHCVKSSF